jgi:heme/copper-type cytochrome/quinol oxidase subunit 2
MDHSARQEQLRANSALLARQDASHGWKTVLIIFIFIAVITLLLAVVVRYFKSLKR